MWMIRPGRKPPAIEDARLKDTRRDPMVSEAKASQRDQYVLKE